MIGFNSSNVYTLLYSALKYGNSSISPNIGNLLWGFVWLLIFVLFIIEY